MIITLQITIFSSYCSKQNKQVLVDFYCYTEFKDGGSPGVLVPNATTAIREDTIINTASNQDVSITVLNNNIQSLGCQCLSFEDTARLSCKYFAKYCKYGKRALKSKVHLY